MVTQVRSPLIIGHHVLSVLIWPYAVLQHRGLVMILFFVLTEITNVRSVRHLDAGLPKHPVYSTCSVRIPSRCILTGAPRVRFARRSGSTCA